MKVCLYILAKSLLISRSTNTLVGRPLFRLTASQERHMGGHGWCPGSAGGVHGKATDKPVRMNTGAADPDLCTSTRSAPVQNM